MAKQAQYPTGVSLPDEAAPEVQHAGGGLGRLSGFSVRGLPVVELLDSEAQLEAPTTVRLTAEDVGCMVLVTFVGGRLEQAVISGRIQESQEPRPEAEPEPASIALDVPLKIEADGKAVVIEAEQELVLRCGKASLRLRRDGFVEVRGVDVLSRADRANWIKGGSVALN